MPDARPIAWTSWPIRDEPAGKTALLIAVILATATLALFQGGPFAAALALLLLFLLLGPYFLPTHFELSDRGVNKQFPLFNRNRNWDVYKRYAAQKDGVFLGTFPRPSRLDSYRGDFLRFDSRVDRQAVLELVRRHVPPTAPPPVAKTPEPPDDDPPEVR